MKKILLFTSVTLTLLSVLTATAGRKIYMYSSDGNHLSMDVAKLDSISLEEPAMITIVPSIKTLENNGGRFIVNITANKSWNVTVGDPSVLTVSKTSGTGNDQIYVLAQPNADYKPRNTYVKFELSGGTSQSLYVTVEASIPDSDTTKEEIYGGKDSDGDHLTLILTTVRTKEGTIKSQTYELYYGESKKSEDYNEFSSGTFKVENGGAIYSFSDYDGTTFQMVADGKNLKFDNGEPGKDHYAFELILY